ncbi:MAG TPA: hypothetical protein VGJ18_09120 [Gemmatimonadaceae bacterium]|jgi:hypothetical protein
MRKLVLSALLAVLVACGGDATGPNASLYGNYTLRTVDGNNVPAVVYQDTLEKDELTAGNINLNGDLTWSGSLSVRATLLATGAIATLSLPANGTYTTSSGTITLTETSDGAQLVGTVGGGTLTLGGDIGTGSSTTLVFKR